jgi:outer membrane receptor for ferrienterochelin and colicin
MVTRLAWLLLTLLNPTAVQDATLRGIVSDSTGAPIANARVQLLSSLQTVASTTTTRADGRFEFNKLAPGSYVLQVTAAGFAEQRVVAEVAETAAPLAIRLEVAGLREDVTVTATPGAVESVDSAAQPVVVVNAEDIQRRVRTVVAEAVAEEPGIALQRTSPTMAGVFVRGLTGNKVNVFVDGVRYSNGAQRGGVNTFLDLIDPGFVNRLEVLRGPSSTQYGSDALGGSVQFQSSVPRLAAAGREYGLELRAGGQTAHRGGHAGALFTIATPRVGVFTSIGTRGAGDVRAGDGIDSHSAVTRFLGLPSTTLVDERLPGTGFTQHAGLVKVNWTPNPRTQVVTTYAATRQDEGQRFDQLLGGDGNLIADLDDLTLDLFYARVERHDIGWFDHVSGTWSINSQREERINQGGNGNPRATIGHEPERTTVNGVSALASKDVSPRQTFDIGGDVYFERLTSDAFNVNPVTGVVSVRRPRVPSGATFRQGGVFVQTAFAAVPDRLRLLGAVRVGGARYEAEASDSPTVDNAPLWPDDELTDGAVTFRASAVTTPNADWTLAFSVARGFRAPHMTDLGTLGLTGSGFEVAAPDVEGRGATVGNSAAATAVSTGRAVAQLEAESNVNFDATARFHRRRARAELTFFVNTVRNNIQKQALILPPGAVGTNVGGEVITSQTPNGTVFVAAATAPVLVRANFDRARIWGIEHSGQFTLAPSVTLDTVFTYLRSEDLDTGLAPNIEGGTPAPEAYVLVQYAPAGKRWWLQPYLHAAWDQPHLSSLDVDDRRTGASRSRTSIRNFFLNGATARGWVAAGGDGVFGTADDVLTATNETLAQVQDRVLGVGVNSNVLFPEVPGYVAVGVRAGIRFGQHELIVEGENLTDRNYRGISWGVDAPGRGIAARFIARF